MPPAAIGVALGAAAGSTAAVGLGTMVYIGAGLAAAQMISSQQAAKAQGKAAAAAADAQKAVGLAQIEAPLKAEALAAETAKQQLKLRQASKSQMILTPPSMEDASTNQPSILGVPS